MFSSVQSKKAQLWSSEKCSALFNLGRLTSVQGHGRHAEDLHTQRENGVEAQRVGGLGAVIRRVDGRLQGVPVGFRF